MTLGECDDQLLELRQQDVRPQQLGHADTVQRTVRVLGPVEAVVDGQSRPLRPMARRLLAVLAVMSGRVVRTEQILCRLWPESLPATADKTLQSHVLHLRRALGPTAVAHRSGGYALDTSVVSVDSVRLVALVARAEAFLVADSTQAAADCSQAAVEISSGMPFDEFAMEEFAAAAVAHLQELSWRAVELRAECAIRLGAAPGAVGYLERLVTDQPLRESAWVLLIRALISSGRHCHAAGAAERARTILDQELGTEPRAALWAAADHELARLHTRRTVT